MIKRLLEPLGRWPAAEALVARLSDQLLTTSRPADDLGPLGRASIGTRMSGAIAAVPLSTAPPRPPVSIAPGTFETRFMRLHAEGRFEQMWDMLAEDSQRAWGGRETFVREMPRLDQWMEIVEMEVLAVKIVPSWTDHLHQRTYSNVAELVMRYRVRQHWRDWTLERQVHLIPGGGGWRTLCYPTRPRTSADSTGGAASR